MVPNQKINGEMEWNPFGDQYGDDDIFDKADGADSSDEDNYANLDKLLDEPKISLSTQSRTNKPVSSNPFSVSSNNEVDQFFVQKKTSPSVGMNNQYQYPQTNAYGYGMQAQNRFSAPNYYQNN